MDIMLLYARQGMGGAYVAVQRATWTQSATNKKRAVSVSERRFKTFMGKSTGFLKKWLYGLLRASQVWIEKGSQSGSSFEIRICPYPRKETPLAAAPATERSERVGEEAEFLLYDIRAVTH